MKHTPYLYAHAITHGDFHRDQHMVCAWSDLAWLECRSDIICSAAVINWLQALLMLQWPLMSHGAHQHISQLTKVVDCVLPREQCYFLTYNWLRHIYVQCGCDPWTLSFYLALLDNNTPIPLVKVMHLNFDRSKCIRRSTHAAELHTACSSAFYWSVSIT